MAVADSEKFVAELLERSASGYAGAAASLMLEQHPELKDSEAFGAMPAWKAHLTQRVLELSAALSNSETRLFSARVLWSRRAFLARGQDTDPIVYSLQALKQTLAESLPQGDATSPGQFIDDAIAALESTEPSEDESELEPANQIDRITLRYLQLALEGRSAEAVGELKNAMAERALDAATIYLRVLLPAQKEIGRLWHAGDVSVSEEHLVSTTTQRAMAILSGQHTAVAANGNTVVAAAVAGNAHDIGIRAAADLYQLAGWRSIFLGSDVPVQDLPGMLTNFEADVLLLGATLSTHLNKLRRSIKRVREQCERPVKIIVGGAALDEAPGLWRELGADAYAASVESALSEGERLVNANA